MTALGDHTMKQARRVLGGAACAATVAGLLLPMGAAVAEGTPCTFTDNTTTKTHALNGDCSLTSTLQVDDGWTIDGNSHTISIDTSGGPFTGPVIESTPGPNTAGDATSMTVEHLTIDAAGSGASAGILFNGATGAVHQVTIAGAGSIDYGVEVDNSVGAPFGAGQVAIDRATSIDGYRLAAVYVHGNAKFKVLKSVIGDPQGVPGQAAAGIRVEGGAHGFITQNQISLSDAEPPATPTTFRAGVSLYETLRVEVKKNLFIGGDADFGVSVENPAQTQKTTAAVTCNLFRRNDTSATDTYGVAVGQWGTGSKTNLQVAGATFRGNWKYTTGIVNPGTNTVSAGPANEPSTKCPPTTPTHVVAAGGNGQSKVTWHASTTAEWAPALTGYTVKAKAAHHPTVSKTVAANATSAVLKGLKNGVNYTVTVTARSNGGSAAGTDHLYATKLSLKAKPGRIHRGQKAVLHGKLTSMDPKAHLAKRHVAIWAKPKGRKWRQITTVRTKSDGSFALRVKPHKRTTYKAFYAGRPDLASAHKTKVVVRR
jgi:hypothetical protein